MTRGSCWQPGNLLVNKNCDLKICDFGLARLEEGQDGGPSTMTVSPRPTDARTALLAPPRTPHRAHALSHRDLAATVARGVPRVQTIP